MYLVGEGEVGDDFRLDGEGVAKNVDFKEVEMLVDGGFEEGFEFVDALGERELVERGVGCEKVRKQQTA